MKIAAIVKIKHGEIWKALETLGWSQSELARQAGLQPTTVGEIINLKKRPTENEVKKIELAFLTEGLIVDVISEWPELFTSRGKSMTYYKDIESDRLLSENQSLSLENKEMVQMLFDKLSLLEVDIIMMNRVEGISLKEIAKKHNCTPGNVSRVSIDLNNKIIEFNEKLGVDGTDSKDSLTKYLGGNISPFSQVVIETENKNAFKGRFPQLAKVVNMS